MKKIIAVTTFVLTLILASLSVAAQTRDDILKEIEAKRAEIAALEKKFLSPSEVDHQAFSEFLAQPDTGMTRLMPREKFDSEAYPENKRILTTRGGGSYYSFTRKTHEYSEHSTVQLERGSLSVGFIGTNYGMLTTVGDVPLESVNLSTPAVRTLANHHPPTEMQQARLEQHRIYEGLTVDGMVLKNRAPVDEKMTYVLRSINFGTSDALVAFRVVRVDTDGSVILLWKLLKKGPIPQLVRN